METSWLMLGVGALVVYLGFKIVTGLIKKILLFAIIAAGVWAYLQYIK